MATQSTNWAEFLADLERVCPKPDDGTLPVAFLDDLEVAFRYACASSLQRPAVSVEDLAALAETFEKWRAHYRNRLKNYLESDRLRPDDPLRCPVSLFGTMDYGRLETAHTRTLAWLLDPNREHGFGSKLLEAVIAHVLNGRAISELRVDRVESEFPIFFGPDFTDSGRIDIFAKGSWNQSGTRQPWVVAIEAKIDAMEGAEQLSLYDQWLDGCCESSEVVPEIIRVFLTPNGREPSTGSPGWQTLSFVDLAGVLWHVLGLSDKPGYHFLRYYLAGVLRDVCGLALVLSVDTRNPYPAVDYLQSVIGDISANS
jgi:hypothetical protein